MRSGTVALGTRNITNLATERTVRAGVVHVPEGRGLFATMSVEDNIRVGGYTLNGALVETRVAQVLELFPQMVARRRQPAGQLSGGEQQMVAMMRGLMVAPHVLLLDSLLWDYPPLREGCPGGDWEGARFRARRSYG